MSVQNKNLDEYVYKSNFASIIGIMYVYMEDILSSSTKIVNDVINFLIRQGQRLYSQKSLSLLFEDKLKKIQEDHKLQEKWGDEWENHKSPRTPDDPSNRHPGNPKATH